MAAGTLGTAAGPADGSQAKTQEGQDSPEVDMAVLIVSVGIVLVLVLTLTVSNHRERRTRSRIALDESGIIDARRYNDATGQR